TDAPEATEDSPSATATSTPAPTVNYEDVQEAETVHGVSIGNQLRIAETLVTAIDQIEQENARKEVSIEIINVEKILTADEKTRLDTLSAKEQILALLSCIGYKDEVDVALRTMELTLSDEALSLIDFIQERLSTATAEEKAAFEKALIANFPIESIEIDGITYDYFIIELMIKVDNEVHVERYGFRFNEDAEWIFTKLSIGTFAQ
ncbi:MAG: hypothetical protein Q4E13_13940, partial [Clostridia bacterium]|nr:hypothetical protein [Clostridia bacterium]